MDIMDLAISLFGTTRAETTARADITNTSTIYGVAHGNSEDGHVPVYISDYITLPEGSSGGPYVDLPTSPSVSEGDVVAISLIGAGSIKHPYISAVIGSGDKIRKENKDTADGIKQDLDNIDKEIADFKETANKEYVHSTYTDPETGETIDTLSEYLKNDDASKTYVSETTYKKDAETFEQSIRDTYTKSKQYTDDAMDKEVVARNSAIKQTSSSILLSVFSYHGNGVPTTDSLPASEWSDTDKSNRKGYIFEDEDSGTMYVWDGEKWAAATEADIEAAATKAAKASVEILADAITSVVNGKGTYVDENGNQIENRLQTQIKQNLDSITSTVSNVNSISSSVTKLEQDSTSFRTSIETLDNTVDDSKDFIAKAKSTMSFQNDSNGYPTLSIATTAEAFRSAFSNRALSFFQGDTMLAQIDGPSSTLAVDNLQIGTHYIWKPNSDGTGMSLIYVE